MFTAAHYRSQADKCRMIACGADAVTAKTLRMMAEEYEEQARAVEAPDAPTVIIIKPNE